MDVQGNAEPEELLEDRFYCVHGTFIGNPFGGDYLCGWCEDGISEAEFHAIQRARHNQAHRRQAASAWFDTVGLCSGFPQDARAYNSVIYGVIFAMARWL